MSGTRRLAVVGASGRLGRRIVALAAEATDLELVAACTHAGSRAIGVDAGVLAGVGAIDVPVTPVGEGFAEADVVVDVSLPDGLDDVLRGLGGRALVTGVTGLSDAQLDALRNASEQGPVLRADNFSAGVAVLADLVARAARALPEHDIEVVEAHHRHKVDAPSGTAKRLVRAAAEARGWTPDAVVRSGRDGHTGERPAAEIGVHALRAGDVVGEHTVWLAGDGDRLLLGHVATSRDAFARGALRCARWLVGREAGAYTLEDVLGLV